MTERSRPYLYVSKTLYRMIFTFYIILLLISGFVLFAELMPTQPEWLRADIMARSLYGGMAGAIAFASLYYVRKLYKDSLQDKIGLPNGDTTWFKVFATSIYYLGRPLFASLFAMLIFMGSKLTILLSTQPNTVLSDGFFYLNVLASCYAGALTGRFVKQIETRAFFEITKVG